MKEAEFLQKLMPGSLSRFPHFLTFFIDSLRILHEPSTKSENTSAQVLWDVHLPGWIVYPQLFSVQTLYFF